MSVSHCDAHANAKSEVAAACHDCQRRAAYMMSMSSPLAPEGEWRKTSLAELVIADLSAENARLRAQLDASETAARITELQAACSRHEADARAARAALRYARELFRAAIASERDGGAYTPLPRQPLPPPLPPTPGPGQRVMDSDPGKGAIALLVGIWSKKGTP